MTGTKSKLAFRPGQGIMHKLHRLNPKAPMFSGQIMTPSGEHLNIAAWYRPGKRVGDEHLQLKIEPLPKPEDVVAPAPVVNNQFAANLKHLRTMSRLTQDELSEKTGIARTNIGAYEEGRSVPKFDRLIQIAGFFKVTVDELLKEYIFERDDITH